MLDVADKSRKSIAALASAGFALDNEINLGGEGWLAKNYEIGTIAHFEKCELSFKSLEFLL